MDTKKVVVMAMHDELESVYPPLNIAVGASSSGADVCLIFSRKGVNILYDHFSAKPSAGVEYLSEALTNFGAPSIDELISIALEMGVRFYVVDLDVNHQLNFKYPVEQAQLKWVLNEAAAADLFVHF